jgi:BlaI family transcriptional regulator, penicillinase repressor
MSKLTKPTDSELEILNILWQKGPSTVREVHEILEKNKEAGYTTTLKLMQIMYEKKLLKRDDSSKSHVYESAVNQEQTQSQYIKRMVDNVFNGSTTQMVMQALGNHKADKKEIEKKNSNK